MLAVATQLSETQCRLSILSQIDVLPTFDPAFWQKIQASAPPGSSPVTWWETPGPLRSFAPFAGVTWYGYRHRVIGAL